MKKLIIFLFLAISVLAENHAMCDYRKYGESPKIENFLISLPEISVHRYIKKEVEYTLFLKSHNIYIVVTQKRIDIYNVINSQIELKKSVPNILEENYFLRDLTKQSLMRISHHMLRKISANLYLWEEEEISENLHNIYIENLPNIFKGTILIKEQKIGDYTVREYKKVPSKSYSGIVTVTTKKSISFYCEISENTARITYRYGYDLRQAKINLPDDISSNYESKGWLSNVLDFIGRSCVAIGVTFLEIGRGFLWLSRYVR